MSKKWPLILGIVVIVIALIVGIVFAVNGKKNNNEVAQETKEINMEEVSEKISSDGEFNEMATENITMEALSSYFQINTDNVEKVVGKIPLMNVHASMYMIIKAKDGKVDEVKSELNTYGESYEKLWERYLPDQYELVKNRKIGTVGNYVYLIIAENANTLKDLVK